MRASEIVRWHISSTGEATVEGTFHGTFLSRPACWMAVETGDLDEIEGAVRQAQSLARGLL
jgi:hypothetical protein